MSPGVVSSNVEWLRFPGAAVLRWLCLGATVMMILQKKPLSSTDPVAVTLV